MAKEIGRLGVGWEAYRGIMRPEQGQGTVWWQDIVKGVKEGMR